MMAKVWKVLTTKGEVHFFVSYVLPSNEVQDNPYFINLKLILVLFCCQHLI